MNSKAAVTASMIYLGVLVLFSQGWMAKIRSTVASLSGNKSSSGFNSPVNPNPTGPGGGGGGSW